MAFFNSFGGWISLLFSVIIFSNLLGDHRLARLAQYLLVGLSMGYLGVLAVQFGLRPLLAQSFPLAVMTAPGHFITILLALVLFVAGCEQIFRRQRPDEGLPTSLLRGLGAIPLALMVGTGAAVLLLGAIQGTILPQIELLIQPNEVRSIGANDPFSWLLFLILSAGVLFHLTVHPQRHLQGQIAPLRQLMQLWMWVGERALWFAAGLFFARIFAARYSLLIGVVAQWQQQITSSGLWAQILILLGN